jgi:hypothetical protein
MLWTMKLSLYGVMQGPWGRVPRWSIYEYIVEYSYFSRLQKKYIGPIIVRSCKFTIISSLKYYVSTKHHYSDPTLPF